MGPVISIKALLATGVGKFSLRHRSVSTSKNLPRKRSWIWRAGTWCIPFRNSSWLVFLVKLRQAGALVASFGAEKKLGRRHWNWLVAGKRLSSERVMYTLIGRRSGLWPQEKGAPRRLCMAAAPCPALERNSDAQLTLKGTKRAAIIERDESTRNTVYRYTWSGIIYKERKKRSTGWVWFSSAQAEHSLIYSPSN